MTAEREAWDLGVKWALERMGYEPDWLDTGNYPEDPTRESANPYLK